MQIIVPGIVKGGRTILAPMRIDLNRGEMLAVVGPNGAGKSTLLASVAGLGAPGTVVTLQDRPLHRHDIGFLPQNFAVRSALSVLDCILLGRREALGLRVRHDLIEAARALLTTLGLADLADRPMIELSGGQQQRVLIAQRIFRQPKLLVLDEPTSALDLHHQLEILAQLRREAEVRGTTIILALHDLTLAARFSDRVVVLADGRKIVEAPPRQALRHEVIRRHWNIDPDILVDRNSQSVFVPQMP